MGVAAGFVRLSDPNQKKYLVEKMFLHEDFRPSLMYNDIAIIKVSFQNITITVIGYLSKETTL